MNLSNEFWDGFWSNLLSNIAFLGLITLGGYFAKNRLIQNLKQFISNEVKDIVKEVNENETQIHNGEQK